jgi:hypothetical protein
MIIFVTMYNKFTQKAKMIRFPHNTLYMLYNHKTHLLFTVSAVGVFYCWDAENEVRLFEKQVNVTRVSDMIWKNESDIIILAQKSDWHRVDIKGSPIVIETMNDHSYVSAIAATPDQRYFITGGFSGHIYI